MAVLELGYGQWCSLLCKNSDEKDILHKKLAEDPADAELRVLLEHVAERNAVLLHEYPHYMKRLALDFVALSRADRGTVRARDRLRGVQPIYHSHGQC
jgi:hypothetical protein